MRHLLVLPLLLLVSAKPLSGHNVVHSGQLSTPWAITDDANTVCHAYWDGTQIQDTKGCAWSMVGTVVQVARSGSTPPGAGPFTATTRYTLGSGSDVLDFTGAFTTIVIVDLPANGSAYPVIVGDGIAGTSGWGLYIDYGVSTNRIALWVGNTTKFTANALVAGTNVICAGYTGTQLLVKVNLGTAVIANATPIAATTIPASIGAYTQNTASQFWGGVVRETWDSTTAVSDANCIAAANSIKSKLGITAW